MLRAKEDKERLEDVALVQPGLVEREFTVKERNQWKMAYRRFLRHRAAAAGVIIFILLCLFAFVGPLVWKYDYLHYTNDLFNSPSGTHPFGTDRTGYDEMAVVMRGTAQSLKVAFIIGILGTTL